MSTIGGKKKGLKKKKPELTEELKEFLHDSRALHSKASVIQLAKFAGRTVGDLPKGTTLLWRGEGGPGQGKGGGRGDDAEGGMTRSRQMEEEMERQRERHARAAQSYVGPLVQKDDLRGGGGGGGGAGGAGGDGERGGGWGKGKGSKKLLKADPGWQDTVRPLWMKEVSSADVEGLLKEAEMADMMSRTALADADMTRQKVLMSASGSRAGSRAGSVMGRGSRAGSVAGSRREYSRPGTASTVRSRAVMSTAGGGGGGGGGGGRSRPHSSMDGVGVDPNTLVPFAAPFRAGSAYHKLRKAEERASSAEPPRPSSQHIKLPPPDAGLSVQEKWEMMAQPGTYYHRQRTDITSARLTRAGLGKAKGWEKQIREPLEAPKAMGMEDRQEKRREQERLAREIAAAAAAKPIEVPISFEPQHSALPVKRGVGEDWGFTNKYLPAAFARWHPGNRDPPYVNHLQDKASWQVHQNSN